MIVSGWHVQICSDIVFLLSGNVQLPIHQIQGHNAFGVLHRMSNLGMKLPKQDLEENLGSSFFRNLSNTKLAYLEHRAHLLFCPSNHSKAKRSTTGDYNHVVPTNLLSKTENINIIMILFFFHTYPNQSIINIFCAFLIIIVFSHLSKVNCMQRTGKGLWKFL